MFYLISLHNSRFINIFKRQQNNYPLIFSVFLIFIVSLNYEINFLNIELLLFF